MTDKSKNILIIGAGTIGTSWAALFLAFGHSVHIYDIRKDVQDFVHDELQLMLKTILPELSDSRRNVLVGRVIYELRLEEAAANPTLSLIQDNGPENIEYKQTLWANIEKVAPKETTFISSTSTITATIQSKLMQDPTRLIVAHPFNPPHLLPLVEIVPGEHRDESRVEALMDFFKGCDREPVYVRKETEGFIGNRLAFLLLRESLHLVEQGVVSAEDIDKVVTSSLGIRWSIDGPFRSYHMGGGRGGLKHFLTHLGPAIGSVWKSAGTPDLSPELIETVANQTHEAYGSVKDEMFEQRDRLTREVLKMRVETRREHEEYEEEYHCI
ncbi:hypothetical protein YB2330_004685 [Saitoella coloradoensis]